MSKVSNQTSWRSPLAGDNDANSLENPKAAAGKLLQRIAPFGDPRLSFELVAPGGWIEDRELPPIDSPEEYLAPIARFYCEEQSETPSLEINFTILNEEVSLEDWFDLYAQLGDLAVIRQREGVSVDRESVRYRTRQQSYDRPCIAEYGLFRDGKRLFMVIAIAPEEDFPLWEEEFERAVASFKLLQPSRDRFAESVTTHYSSSGDPFFSYPSRWTIEPVTGLPPGKAAFDLRFEENEAVEGYMRIKRIERALYPSTAVEDIVRDARDEVESSGFQPNARGWRKVKQRSSGSFKQALTLHVSGTFSGAGDEVWVRLAVTDTAIYVFTLLTPAKDENVRQWLLNRRAFEILFRSVNPR